MNNCKSNCAETIGADRIGEGINIRSIYDHEMVPKDEGGITTTLHE
jgi:hypothetical protein